MSTQAYDYPQGAVQQVSEQADEIGQQGWELLNYTVHFRTGKGDASGSLGPFGGPTSTGRLRQQETVEYRDWSATAIFKRPLAP